MLEIFTSRAFSVSPLSRIMDPLVPDHSNVRKLAMHLALGSAGSEVLTGRLNKYCLVIG